MSTEGPGGMSGLRISTGGPGGMSGLIMGPGGIMCAPDIPGRIMNRSSGGRGYIRGGGIPAGNLPI